MPEFILRRANLSDIIDLRHAVLRQGLPRDAAIFEGDDASSTRHYAACIVDGSAEIKVVGCATFHLNQWLGSPAWQLRGMATDPAFRAQGLGRRLLRLADEDVLGDPSAPRQLWCNARTPAIGFYQKLGWNVESGVFEIPTAGPHVKMSRRVE